MALTKQEAFDRDHALSRKKSPAKKSMRLREKWDISVAIAQEYSATVLVMLYIVNGILASAILFDIVVAPKSVRYMVSALAIAYSAVGFVMFVNRGVKHQLAERKAKREE